MPGHVILGAGVAGLNAIDTIRQADAEGPITLISAEPPYARMALPYFLASQIPQARLATASEGTFSRLGVDARLGRRAVAVDTTARTVRLDNNEVIPFDTLLVATGSAAVRPGIPGIDGKNVFTLWTMQDAIDILTHTTSRPSAVIVGGGFIGLIVLNALHKLRWKLTLIELEGHVLPRMLDRRGAGCVERQLRDHGVDVFTGCRLNAIDGARTRKQAVLSDGHRVAAQMIIVCTGIRPNLSFLAGSGIGIGEGILVDEHLSSTVPGIFAAGDVAQGPDLLGGPRVIHAIQPTAVDHGRVAGANMAGRRVPYPGSLAMNILDVAGLHCASFGHWQAEADTTVLFDARRSVYRKLVWEGSRLAGGILVGPLEDTTMLADVGMLKGLIQSRVDLGGWKAYLRERPWDLRRAYIGSDAASALRSRTTTGEPARPRGYRFENTGPRAAPSEHHAALVEALPRGFDTLPRTPTPGLHKPPPAAKD